MIRKFISIEVLINYLNPRIYLSIQQNRNLTHFTNVQLSKYTKKRIQ